MSEAIDAEIVEEDTGDSPVEPPQRLSPTTLGGLKIRKPQDNLPFLNMMLYGDSGVGKGHPFGTDIITPHGTVSIELLNVGDEVIGSNGLPTTVTGIFDRGTLPVFEVQFNDGYSVKVDGDHLWNVKSLNDRYRNKDYRTLDTSWLASNCNGQRKWSIPIVNSIEFYETEHIIHPYVMGVLLGDGGFTGSSISLTTDRDTALRVESFLPHEVKLVPKTARDNYYITTTRGSVNPILEEIKRLELHTLHSYSKFIPNEYKIDSVANRIELLRGIMDTDGELSARSNESGVLTQYSSSSKTLRDDVAFLIQSLGGLVRANTRKITNYTYKGERKTGLSSYRLSINIPINPFSTRKGWAANEKYKPTRIIKSIEPAGSAEVRCISVDASDQLYVTEHCIVTHNTLLAGSAAFVEELSPVLFVDIEGGTLTLGHFDNTADIDVVRADTWPAIQKVYNELYAGRHGYKTVVIDSLTELQKLAMASQLGYGKDFEPGGNMPEFKDWGINTEQIRRVVRGFRDLEMNTIFTALAMVQPHPRNAAIELIKPAFTKKLAGEIPAFFDILFYMYIKSIKNGPNQRLLLTDKTDTTVAKCRVQGVPEVILDPTMEGLYDLLIRNPSTVSGKIEVVRQGNAASATGGMAKKRR